MSARGRFAADAGFSLAEILVAIVIVGIVFSAILGGLMTSITASALQRKQAAADALARDAAESLKNVKVAYAPCADTNTIPYISALPSGASITKVEYWNAAAPAASYPVTFTSSCPPDNGLQRITIAATSGGVTEWVQILKGKSS
jgi:prepilin-type N-terminal cleavage/methylation domain-containing protein